MKMEEEKLEQVKRRSEELINSSIENSEIRRELNEIIDSLTILLRAKIEEIEYNNLIINNEVKDGQ